MPSESLPKDSRETQLYMCGTNYTLTLALMLTRTLGLTIIGGNRAVFGSVCGK